MRVYRLSKRQYRAIAYTGEGARRVAGRWNLRGRPMVYTSGAQSLAFLEALVHWETTTLDLLVSAYEVCPANIPDALIYQVEVTDLPKDWHTNPPPPSTQNLGTKWMNEGKLLAVSVPSVVIPSERNYLINPLHPDFSQIRIHPPMPFSIDPRIIKKISP